MSTHNVINFVASQFGGTRTLRILPQKISPLCQSQPAEASPVPSVAPVAKTEATPGEPCCRFWLVLTKEVPNSWTFRPFNILFYICCILSSTILTCDAKSTYCTCSPKTCEKECRRHMLTRTKSRCAPTAACILEASQGGFPWLTVSDWWNAAKNQDTKP